MSDVEMSYSAGDFNVQVRNLGDVCVYLPHSCDQWCIAGEPEESWGDTRDNAVETLKAFIENGQRALGYLEGLS